MLIVGEIINKEKQAMIQKKLIERTVRLMMDDEGKLTREKRFVVPEGYTVVDESMNGVPAEHLIPDQLNTDIVVLQCHGGAYIDPLVDIYRHTAVFLSDNAGGAEVYTIDYRVPPNGVFPAALEDGVAAYKYLLEKGIDPDKIVLEGDSAGGNLIFATALYLRDHDIPLPKLMIALSPWNNLEYNTPSRTKFEDIDFVLGNKAMTPQKKELKECQYAHGHDLRDPYLSPYFGDFHGFRNVLIQVGSYEILLDDSVDVAEKLKQAGANVKLSVYDEMFHTFQNVVPDLEESKQAWEEIRQMIKDTFK